MKARVTLILAAALAAALSPPPAAQAVPAAREDLLFSGGRILASVEDSAGAAVPRWAEAVLVHDGRIAAAGPRAAVEAEARRLALKPRRVDLSGGLLTPGLCDAHGHVTGLGLALRRLRLQGTRSPDEIQQMVMKEAAHRPKGEWILGRGWDQNDWAEKVFPDRSQLDPGSPNNPVWLRRVDGHAGWANYRALDLAGVDKTTPDPEGGRIYRYADGSPSGVFVDNAMALIERAIAPTTREQTRAAILRACRHCAKLGLTAVHDPGIDTLQLSVYRELAAAGELPIRVFAMLSAATALQPGMLDQKVAAGDGMFRVFAVKAYADGALGSRGAALLAPYSDDPGNSGLLVTRPDTLQHIARLCLEHGWPMCTHAIGDRGNRVTLDAYETAARASGRELPGRRFRIEHAQVLTLDDIPRLAKDGVIASMQPTHCTSDMPWAPARLGAARIEGAYAWRRLLNSGARLALGSDFPVEDADPRFGLFAAVTTQAPDGTPAGGFRPSEKLTLWEALRGFTSDAAYAAFAEDEVGRLAPGQRADLVVWDRDFTAGPAAGILTAKCVMTVVDGAVVR